MRSDIEFDADGTTLRGWLVLPDAGDPPFPAVVMAHGFSAVKEQTLDLLSDVLAASGFACVVYDHRNLGASDGEPRQDIDPVAQVRDYRHAISHAATLPEVDPGRIGIFGSSYSGAHVLAVAAIDQRVRCVASQVPLVNGFKNVQRLIPAEAFPALLDQLDAERAAAHAGAPPSVIPVCSDDPAGAAAFPGLPTYDYFHGFGDHSPGWRNEVTVRSIDWALEYDVTPYMERISPRPLLMVVAASDETTPTDLALEAFDLAHEPKRLVVLPGHHYDAYHGDFPVASRAAAEFFAEHLGAAPA